MILETAQLLSTALHVVGDNPPFNIYKPTHRNHPCAIWARGSLQHYKWLVRLGMFLCIQYTVRYGKVHKTHAMMQQLYQYKPPIKDTGWFDPPQAMPDQYKHDDPVIAYQNYYREGKSHLLSYRLGKIPEFLS